MKILEENSYYPFGMKHATYSNNDQPNYKYKYNGKEYQDELGLNLTAMDYRQYDNTLGRFNVIDPLAEQDYGITPYHFGYNNPVLFGDPSGLKAMAPESMENNIVPGSVLAMFASGMNGLQVRDALEQQAWGPNFFVNIGGHGGGGGGGSSTGTDVVRYDGAGGVHLLTTNYQTGASGYWDRRYVGNEDTPFEDSSVTINGVTYLTDCVIKPIYQNIWTSLINSSPSQFDLVNGAFGNFLFALDKYSTANAGKVYNYGTKLLSAAALTEANAARMLKISTSAQYLGNTLGIVTGIYTLGKTVDKQMTTGEVDVKGYLDGSIGLIGGIAGFMALSNPVGWGVIATVAAGYGIASFVWDVYQANKN